MRCHDPSLMALPPLMLHDDEDCEVGRAEKFTLPDESIQTKRSP